MREAVACAVQLPARLRSCSVCAMSGNGSGSVPSSGAENSGPNGSTGRPSIGAKASTMSLALVTRHAPCLSRLLEHAERGLSGLPARQTPHGPAHRPERSAASTTTTPSRNARDQAIAVRKVLAARREAWASLAEGQPLFADGVLEIGVLRRIDDVNAAGEHGDGTALGPGKERSGVDAPCQTRGGDDAFRPGFVCKVGVNFCPIAEPLRAPTMAMIGLP